MSKIWFVGGAAMLAFFFMTNAVWTSIDGKPRPGSAFFEDNRVLTFLMELPNPFLPDPSEFLLEPLPQVDGWVVTQIADPWTVRPIRRDGTIPTDDEMEEIIARRSSELTRGSYERTLSQHDYRNSVHRNDGAKRTGANFSRGEDVALNVIVELVREPLELSGDQFSGLERYFFEVSNTLSVVSDVMTPRLEIAGLTFLDLRSRFGSTQDEMRDARIGLVARNDTYTVRVWGHGTEQDVEALITALRELMVDHPSKAAFEM